MVIRPGQPWGEPNSSGAQETLSDDASLAAAVLSGLYSGTDGMLATPNTDVALSVGPGDVLKTVGLDVNRPSADQLRYPFDLGLARLDGNRPVPFAAHLLARRKLWSGTFLVAMNVSWCGDKYLGPKAHPNDGLLDITTGSLDLRQRVLARRRTITGTHIPHPDLSVARRSHYAIEFDVATPVYLDGHRSGVCQTLEIDVVPDAFSLIA